MSGAPNTRIPKPTQLKPPNAPTTKLMANLKSATKGKNHKDLPGPSTVSARERMLSRRSKTFASLHNRFKDPNLVLDPKQFLNTKAEKEPKVVDRRQALLRRSQSFVHVNENTAPIKSDVHGIETKPSTSTRVALKRPTAPTPANGPAQAKVPKGLKPPPAYDYKARYNLLLEKYNLHMQSFKDLKAENKNINEVLERNEELQDRLNTHEERLHAQEIELQDLRLVNEEHNTLQEQHAKLQKEHRVSQADLEQCQKFAKLMEDDNDQLKEFRDKYHIQHEALEKLEIDNVILTEQLKTTSEELKEYKNSQTLYKEAYNEKEDLCRKLHNNVQDLKGNIRVFCRVRPSKSTENDRIECNMSFIDESTFEIRKQRESLSVTGKLMDPKQEFSFDKVFPPNALQGDVFEDLSQLVQSALDGYDVCVFAYGQTGSGKTFTMMGEGTQEGMIPLSIKQLFSRIQELEDLGWHYTLYCNFLEIYNENIKDLLNPDSTLLYEIRFNEGKGTTVTNLHTESVQSADDLMYLMAKSQQNRAIAATDYNEHSSRSHYVAKVMINGMKDSKAYSGSINLVDLAGSECAKSTNKEREPETKSINKSLSALGNVMMALHKKEGHIPYRNSKLTYLLHSCLGGNSKTLMFVNIAPFDDCYHETMSSLRFAATVKEVKNGLKRNKTYCR